MKFKSYRTSGGRYAFFIFIPFLLSFGVSGAQSVTGSVTSGASGAPLPGANIALKGTNRGVIADIDGRYSIRAIPGDVLIYSYAGFRTKEISVGTATVLDIALEEDPVYLDEVVVRGGTAAGKIRNSPVNVSVLETANMSARVVSNADVLATIPGVNVRQNGGLGSDASFSINGMSGKQIRFFLDGIPLEHYGSEMNIASIPARFFSRFEVYKGAIPVHLASDALGGAVNLVSHNDLKSNMDVSYGAGSFNTHKLILNARHHGKRAAYFGLSAFVNHSDNNYKMEAEVLDRDGNSHTANVRRFHNRFTNYMLRPEFGVKNTAWADQAFVSFYFSGNRAELQHDALANQPYGEALSKNSSWGTLIRYRKQEILKNLDTDAYIVAGYSQPRLIDTSLNVYNWNGEIIATRNQGGEISSSGNDLHLKDKNISGQVSTTWHLSENTNVSGSLQQSYFHRKGSDEIAAAYYGTDYYANPQSVHKTIGGLALNIRMLDKRLTSVTSAKYYNFRAEGYSRSLSGFDKATSNKENLGFGEAVSYRVNEKLAVKTSYEYAVRIPSVFELFGDQMLVLPNPSLAPEISHNINLGMKYAKGPLKAELSGFYRNTDNIIWQRPSSYYFMHQNLTKSSSAGIEGELNYDLSDAIRINLNATYQDIRNRSDVDGSDRYFNKRIPNTPYLFGNAHIGYTHEKLLWKTLKWQLWYNMRYVEQFYLFWDGDGNREDKNTIPSQYSGNMGSTITQKEGKYSLTVECRNIFNEKLYDNFRVQNPGRAIYLTLDYTIK